jgi:hypothetical protein
MRLVIRKTLYLARAALGILLKGGALPLGSIRVWGGVKYRKFGPGDWRQLVEGKRLDKAADGVTGKPDALYSPRNDIPRRPERTV